MIPAFIHIGIDPDMIAVGTFRLTWHGFFTFVGVAVAVVLTARWARTRETLDPDVIYSTAIWAIIGGVIGARLIHVIDFWDFYWDNPGQIIAIYNGGIALYGGILGGFVGGYLYARWRKLPVGRIADITAPAILVGQFLGRIGDIINGEHCANVTGLPWGFVYTHPDSPARVCSGFIPSFPMHPAVGYEMILDLAVFGVIWALHRRLRPPGMLFLVYLTLYSVGRFVLSFLRTDGNIDVGGLSEAHFIALGLMIIAVPWLAAKAQWVKREWPRPPRPPRVARQRR